jgi:hypothetical protein
VSDIPKVSIFKKNAANHFVKNRYSDIPPQKIASGGIFQKLGKCRKMGGLRGLKFCDN